jgi:hypothetical protein
MATVNPSLIQLKTGGKQEFWLLTSAFSQLRGNQGPMLCFLKNFRRKNSAKKWEFLTQNKAELCKNLIVTLVFEKNANFAPKNVENRRKL